LTVQGCSGTPVARADLKPGDLVFWYSPVGHVSMYIGNGQGCMRAGRPTESSSNHWTKMQRTPILRNGQMVHARGTAYEVVQQSLDEDAKNAYFAGARRFVGP